MKRRKCRYVDQRDVEACIDQLQAIIDGLRSGSMALEEDEQALLLRPRGLLDFELRVEQLETKETLRVEMSWKLGQRGVDANAAPASGPRPVQAEAAVIEGPIVAWPKQAPATVEVREVTSSSPESAEEEAGEEEISADELLVEDFGVDELSALAIPAGNAHVAEPLAAEDAPLDSAVMACSCAARPLEDPISGWPPPRSIVAEYHQLYADACCVGSDGQWHLDRDQLVQSLARAGVDPLTQQELYSSALQADLDRTSWFSARVVAALERASQRPLAAVG
jgi:amphi-Trp domain-containing protein